MKNDSEVMSKIIRWMISEIDEENNVEYISKLKIILSGIENKKFIEENKQPRFQSIVLFGINLFPYKIEDYRKMSEILIQKNIDK